MARDPLVSGRSRRGAGIGVGGNGVGVLVGSGVGIVVLVGKAVGVGLGVSVGTLVGNGVAVGILVAVGTGVGVGTGRVAVGSRVTVGTKVGDSVGNTWGCDKAVGVGSGWVQAIPTIAKTLKMPASMSLVIACPCLQEGRVISPSKYLAPTALLPRELVIGEVHYIDVDRSKSTSFFTSATNCSYTWSIFRFEVIILDTSPTTAISCA